MQEQKLESNQAINTESLPRAMEYHELNMLCIVAMQSS